MINLRPNTIVQNQRGRIGRIVEVSDEKARVLWADSGQESAAALSSLETQPEPGIRVPMPSQAVTLRRRFAEVIHGEMKKQNLTWAEVVRRTGVSRSTFARLLRTNGQNQWLETVEQIAAGLGISPGRFWEVEKV